MATALPVARTGLVPPPATRRRANQRLMERVSPALLVATLYASVEAGRQRPTVGLDHGVQHQVEPMLASHLPQDVEQHASQVNQEHRSGL